MRRIDINEKNFFVQTLTSFIRIHNIQYSSFLGKILYNTIYLLYETNDGYEILKYFLMMEFLIKESNKDHKIDPLSSSTLATLRAFTMSLDKNHNNFSEATLSPLKEFSKKINLPYQLMALVYQPAFGDLIDPIQNFHNRCLEFIEAAVKICANFLIGSVSVKMMECLQENCGALCNALASMYDHYYSFTSSKTREYNSQLDKLNLLKTNLQNRLEHIKEIIISKTQNPAISHRELKYAGFNPSDPLMVTQELVKKLNLPNLLNSLNSQKSSAALVSTLQNFTGYCREFVNEAKKLVISVRFDQLPLLTTNFQKIKETCNELLRYYYAKNNQSYLSDLVLIRLFLSWEYTKVISFIDLRKNETIGIDLIKLDLTTAIDSIYDEMVFFPENKYEQKPLKINDGYFIDEYVEAKFTGYLTKINRLFYSLSLVCFKLKNFSVRRQIIEIVDNQRPFLDSAVESHLRDLEKTTNFDEFSAGVKELKNKIFMLSYLSSALGLIQLELKALNLPSTDLCSTINAINKSGENHNARCKTIVDKFSMSVFSSDSKFTGSGASLAENKLISTTPPPVQDEESENEDQDEINVTEDDVDSDDESQELNYLTLIKKFAEKRINAIESIFLSFANEQLASCCKEISSAGLTYLNNLKSEMKKIKGSEGADKEINKIQTYVNNIKNLCIKLNSHYHDRLTNEAEFQSDLFQLLTRGESLSEEMEESATPSSQNPFGFAHTLSSSSSSSSSSAPLSSMAKQLS